MTITASPNPVRVGNAVRISVQVSASEPPFEMAVDFGDGTTSSTRWTATPASSQSTLVSKTYASPGDFTVMATVTTASGAVVRGTVTISVVS
jgi:hypothetical protein